MNHNEIRNERRKLSKLYIGTLNLISLYKKNDFPIPSSLKGNLGELIVAKELLKNFPQSKIDYKGGSFPGIDIALERKNELWEMVLGILSEKAGLRLYLTLISLLKRPVSGA